MKPTSSMCDMKKPDNRIWKTRTLPPKPETPNYTKEYKDWVKLKKFLETPPEGFTIGVHESIRRNKVKVRYQLEDYFQVRSMKDGRTKYILKLKKDDEPKVVEFDGNLPNMEGWRVGDLLEVDVRIDNWTDKNGNARHSYVQPSDVANISLMTGYMRDAENEEKMPLFSDLYAEVEEHNEIVKTWEIIRGQRKPD